MIAAARKDDSLTPLKDEANAEPKTLSPFTTLRSCAEQMAESNLTSYPVVSADGKLAGVVTLNDLLKGRKEQAQRETDRERVLRLRWPFGGKATTNVLPSSPDDTPHPPS